MSQNICDCQNVHLIAPDGGLRHIKPYLVGDLLLQGWRRVDNPKRNYYPEYDQKNPSYNEKVEEVNDDDILIVTKL